MALQEPNMGLNYGWGLGESGWNEQMDENLRAIGTNLHLEVLSRQVSDPSTLTPTDGDRYIPAPGSVGDWLGLDGKIVRYFQSAWEVYTPRKGWRLVIVDEEVLVRYDGTNYVGLPTEATIGNGTLGVEKMAPFAQDANTTSGLTFGYKAGVLRNDNVVYSISAGTKTLTASATNYVEVSSTGTVVANTTGFNSGSIPLYQVVTDGTGITSVTDYRTFYSVGDGGGSGTTLPVADSTAIVKGASDATKLLRFEVDGLSNGVTRVITMPDRDVDLGDIYSPPSVYTTTNPALDRSNAEIQVLNLGANATLSVAINEGQSLTLHLSGGDTYSVTWPTMTWVGGSAPTLTSADVIEFWKVGATLYGAYVGSVA